MSKDTNPAPAIPAESTVTKKAVQALCCECGNLGTFATTRPSRGNAEGMHKPWEGGAWIDRGPDEHVRKVMQRRCAACRTFTTHAILSGDDNKYRDFIEDVHRHRCERGEKINAATGYPWPWCAYCAAGVAERDAYWAARGA